MAWPRKNTRTIQIDGESFLWHISGNQLDSKETVITVGKDGFKFLLFIDPYPWDFEITPSSISKAVRWALDQGWTPKTGPNKNMSYSKNRNTYVWLPKGIRYLHELKNGQNG